MNKIVKRCLARLLGLAILFGMIGSANAALILNDHFAYGNNDALRAKWLPVVAGSFADFNDTFAFANTDSGFISNFPTQRPATLTNQTLIGFNGRSAYYELDTTVNKDFTLTAYVGMNAYARTTQIGVGDSTGAGYSWAWVGAQPTQNGGNGTISIRSQATWANAPGAATGTNLFTPVQGGSPPTRYALPDPITAGSETPPRINYSPNDVFLGYSEVKLTWEAATGLLELYQDGVLKGSVTNTTYNNFTRVYMGGGNRSYVDLVTLNVVPEPASFSLIALGSMLLALARRAKTC